MIGFDEAVALLAGSVLPLGTERVDLIDAAGRVLAEPIHAAIASPRRTVSAMDGYAHKIDAIEGGSFCGEVRLKSGKSV